MKRVPTPISVKNHPLEATIQQTFMAWADLAIKRPCRVWFCPNGLGKLGHYMQAWAKKMGLKMGVSDVHVMWPGGYGVIEFKSRTGALSFEQEEFLHDAGACGHHHGIARTVDEAIALLRAWGCPIDERVTLGIAA